MGEGTTGTLLSATAVTFQDIIPINFQSFTLSSFPAVIAGNKCIIEFSVPNMMRSWLEYHEYNPMLAVLEIILNGITFLKPMLQQNLMHLWWQMDKRK
ncbi:MAG: hypothetical protein IPL23_22820 [Saprospiraceae bacterium]|nr:hypothetical protein [Saprospiraceae bacterium]